MAKKDKESEIIDLRSNLGGKNILDSTEFISTGSTLLDYAIANRKNGGIPVGRITEISGYEAVGKSLLAYHIMANTQKQGGIVVYIDMERSMNKAFIQRMGVDVDAKSFIYPIPPKSIEGVFDYIVEVIKTVRTKIPNNDRKVTIVWDSVASTPAQEQIENKFTDTDRMAPAARAMSSCFPRLMDVFDLPNITLVCINQLREKISALPFAEKSITPHGKSLPFYASCRVQLKKIGKIKEGRGSDRIIGINTLAKVVKNRCGPPHRSVEFPLHFDWGVDDELSWLDFLKDTGHIVTKGAWSTLNLAGDHKFQGTEKFKELMRDEKIKSQVLEIIDDAMTIKFDKKPDEVIVVDDAISESE